jgi:putative cofactor-binding repeat protein
VRMHRLFAVIATIGLVVSAWALTAPLAAARPAALPATLTAGRPTCLVTNPSGRGGYRTLQAAVDAASAGDTLKVKGTCVGTTTISKNLIVDGQANPAFGAPTLDGGGSGPVVTVRATVAINDLTISNGNTVAAPFPGDQGGGIFNGGTLTLTGVTVTANSAWEGAGVFNASGTLTLIDSAVTGNHADSGEAGGVLGKGGGGIFNYANGTVTLVDSTVSGNTSAGGSGGGIYEDLEASVTLGGTSSITGNSADAGGGIFITYAMVTCFDSSSITGNLVGGGIAGYGETLVGCVAGVNVTGNLPFDIS